MTTKISTLNKKNLSRERIIKDLTNTLNQTAKAKQDLEDQLIKNTKVIGEVRSQNSTNEKDKRKNRRSMKSMQETIDHQEKVIHTHIYTQTLVHIHTYTYTLTLTPHTHEH